MMTEQAIAHRRAYLALAVLSCIWGYNWVVMKGALRFCDPFIFSALRILSGSFILLMILAWKSGSIKPRNIPLLILTGLLSTGGGTGISTWALETGGAGRTAILVYTMPFWAIMLGWPVLAERIRSIHWASISLALSGLILILAPWHTQPNLFSSLIAIISGLAWAGGSIMVKVLAKKEDFDLLSVTAWQMLFGAIPIGFVALLNSQSASLLWTPSLIRALGYNILFATVIAGLLWFYVLQQLPTGAATLGSLATPIIGILSAALQLSERPPFLETAGILSILFGIALIAAFDSHYSRRQR